MLEFVQPEEMKNRFNLKLEENATSNEELEKLAENVIKYSLKTGELMGFVWVPKRGLCTKIDFIVGSSKIVFYALL